MVSEVTDLETAYPRPRYVTKSALKAAAMEEQLAALLQSVNDGRTTNDAQFEAIHASLELWRPVVANLQHQVDELRTQMGRIALHPALADPVPDLVVIAASPSTSGEHGHHGPSGHDAFYNSGPAIWGGHHPRTASGQGCVPFLLRKFVPA